MTIASVAAGDPIPASLMNQLIAKINGSPNATVFTANGTWVVPAGAHKFRVTMCGGGGSGGEAGTVGGGEDIAATPGGPGGDSIARRIWVSGADIGTSYSVTIGAGGATGAAGSSSSFGTLLTVSGGGVGASDGPSPTVPGTKGTPGTASAGTLAASALAIGNKALAIYDTPSNVPRAYGEGGLVTDAAGAPGIVIVEW